QGAHQVAQRLISRGWPLNEARSSVSPILSTRVTAGIGSPLWERSSLSAVWGGCMDSVAPPEGRGCESPSLCLSQPAARRAPARTRYLSEREDSKAGSNQMWGGRFEGGPSTIMREINASIPFDKALWRQDIAASKAHVAML